MKNAIIDGLLYSRVADKLNIPTQEYNLLRDRAIELENQLQAKLSPELFKSVLEYSCSIGLYYGEDLENHFAEGFACALRICFECFK